MKFYIQHCQKHFNEWKLFHFARISLNFVHDRETYFLHCMDMEKILIRCLRFDAKCSYFVHQNNNTPHRAFDDKNAIYDSDFNHLFFLKFEVSTHISQSPRYHLSPQQSRAPFTWSGVADGYLWCRHIKRTYRCEEINNHLRWDRVTGEIHS